MHLNTAADHSNFCQSHCRPVGPGVLVASATATAVRAPLFRIRSPTARPIALRPPRHHDHDSDHSGCRSRCGILRPGGGWASSVRTLPVRALAAGDHRGSSEPECAAPGRRGAALVARPGGHDGATRTLPSRSLATCQLEVLSGSRGGPGARARTPSRALKFKFRARLRVGRPGRLPRAAGRYGPGPGGQSTTSRTQLQS